MTTPVLSFRWRASLFILSRTIVARKHERIKVPIVCEERAGHGCQSHPNFLFRVVKTARTVVIEINRNLHKSLQHQLLNYFILILHKLLDFTSLLFLNKSIPRKELNFVVLEITPMHYSDIAFASPDHPFHNPQASPCRTQWSH